MDISSLREPRERNTLTVSELNGYIKRIFDHDRALTALSVRGEISNFVLHRSGHMYFSLKDCDSQIRAVMFRSSAQRLKFMPENGMKVIVHGQLTVFVRDGGYQLYVNSIDPDGIGALYLAYEQLKAKLDGEGLFDESYKKLIPRFPTRVGIITSPTGAAVRDIINVAKRRFPGVRLYLYPALVQGEGAENSLIRGVDYFDRSSLVDVVIIGRGGGSIEDLWAFNSERLARRIFDAKIPVISAVGHETDFTICDFVSDLRAPTPSAAAELAVPDVRSELRYLDTLFERGEKALLLYVSKRRDRLEGLIRRSVLENPCEFFSKYRERISTLNESAKKSILDHLKDYRQRLALDSEKASALSPLMTLARGYSLAEMNNRGLRSVSKVKCGDEFDLILKDGKIKAEVREVFKNEG